MTYHQQHADRQLQIFNTIWKRPNFQAVSKKMEALFNGIRHFPISPSFLAVFYAEGAFNQLRELCFAYGGMVADGDLREKIAPPHPSEELFLISHFAGDALYRLMSIKDKLIAGYYSCFYYHEPEDPYDTHLCRKKLKGVIKRKRINSVSKKALQTLIALDGKNHWRRVELFRHMKTHRLEPKIQFKQIDPARDWIYSKKITKKEAEILAKRDAVTGYGPQYVSLPEDFKKMEIQRYLKLRKFGHCYFDKTQPFSRLISYPDIKSLVWSCMLDVTDSIEFFADVLALQPAFRKNKKE